MCDIDQEKENFSEVILFQGFYAAGMRVEFAKATWHCLFNFLLTTYAQQKLCRRCVSSCSIEGLNGVSDGAEGYLFA